MPDEHVKFWEKFEQQGEDAVRQNLNLGSYGGRKRQYATAWLEKNRQRRLSESEDRDDAFKREQIEIAREATDAAWAAARAARTSTKTAIGALAVAIIAAIVASIGLIAGSP